MQEIPTAEKTQLENFSQSCSSFLFLYFPPTLLIIRQCLWMPLNTHGVCSCLSNLSYKVLHITVKTNAVAFICALLNPAVCEAFAYLFFFFKNNPSHLEDQTNPEEVSLRLERVNLFPKECPTQLLCFTQASFSA